MNKAERGFSSIGKFWRLPLDPLVIDGRLLAGIRQQFLDRDKVDLASESTSILTFEKLGGHVGVFDHEIPQLGPRDHLINKRWRLKNRTASTLRRPQ